MVRNVVPASSASWRVLHPTTFPLGWCSDSAIGNHAAAAWSNRAFNQSVVRWVRRAGTTGSATGAVAVDRFARDRAALSESVVDHPVMVSYLEALRRRAASLPPERREELLLEIRSHLAETVPGDASEAQVRQALDRLGSPEEIVAAECDDEQAPVTRPVEPLRWPDVTGLVLLLFGGAALPPLGYLAGGLLVGRSRRWSSEARVLLVAVPAVIGLMVVVGMIQNGQWYSPLDLVAAPRTTVMAFLDFGLDVLPYTAAQVVALIAARFLPGGWASR